MELCAGFSDGFCNPRCWKPRWWEVCLDFRGCSHVLFKKHNVSRSVIDATSNTWILDFRLWFFNQRAEVGVCWMFLERKKRSMNIRHRGSFLGLMCRVLGYLKKCSMSYGRGSVLKHGPWSISGESTSSSLFDASSPPLSLHCPFSALKKAE